MDLPAKGDARTRLYQAVLGLRRENETYFRTLFDWLAAELKAADRRGRRLIGDELVKNSGEGLVLEKLVDLEREAEDQVAKRNRTI